MFGRIKNKRDVLMICQYFYPDHNSSATLPFDTAKALADSGVSTDVLCGFPYEYSSQKKVPKHEVVGGVIIHRIWYAQFKRTSVIGRLTNYFSFTFHVFMHLYKLKMHKIVMVYSNPPTLPAVAIIAHILFHTQIVFISYDVYPEIARATNTIQAGCCIDRYMKKMNNLLFSKVSKVVVLTDEMKDFLSTNRPFSSVDKLLTIPNWAHETVTETNHDGKDRLGYFKNEFVVGYFGNLGICQDIETLVNAIEGLKESNVCFLIAGHGNKLEEVQKRTDNNPKVKILSFLEGEEFKRALEACSCFIVSLESGLGGLCAPSKYYSYLQAGKPIISISDLHSYLAEEIKNEKIGFSVRCGDIQALKDAICLMADQPELCQIMGQRARQLYENNYTKERSTIAYVRLFHELLSEDER